MTRTFICTLNHRIANEKNDNEARTYVTHVRLGSFRRCRQYSPVPASELVEQATYRASCDGNMGAFAVCLFSPRGRSSQGSPQPQSHRIPRRTRVGVFQSFLCRWMPCTAASTTRKPCHEKVRSTQNTSIYIASFLLSLTADRGRARFT